MRECINNKNEEGEEKSKFVLTEDKNRNIDIDIAAGLCILLVMIGHLVPFDGFVFRVIFSFHMPFFFLKSGYCSDIERIISENAFNFIKKKVRYLLLPSLLMNVISILLGIVEVRDYKEILYFVFVSPSHEWFLIAMFWAWMFILLFLKSLKYLKYDSDRKISIITLVSFSGFFAALFVTNGIQDNPRIPFKATSVCIGMSFILLGMYLKKWYKDQIDRLIKSTDKQSIIVLAVAVLGALVICPYNTYVNMANGYTGLSQIYYLFVALLGTYILYILSNKITQFSQCCAIIYKFLRIMGENSIVVYILQSYLFYIFSKIVFVVVGVQYTPMIDLPFLYGLVYFIVAVLITLPVTVIRGKIRTIRR